MSVRRLGLLSILAGSIVLLVDTPARGQSSPPPAVRAAIDLPAASAAVRVPADVDPMLVLDGPDGKPFTVKYHLLTPMLLNELQTQMRRVTTLDERIAQLEARIGALAKER